MFRFWKKRRLCYRKKMLHPVLDYIAEQFGPIRQLIPSFSERLQEVNVVVIPPEQGREYYTLVTVGMGAHRLRTPKHLSNRLELAIRLPADWDPDSDREIRFWPIRWMQILARMPLVQNTWFTHGHTVDVNRFLVGQAGFHGFALHRTEGIPLHLGKDTLEILYMIPVFREELELARNMGTEDLFRRLGEDSCCGPVDVQRKNTCV